MSEHEEKCMSFVTDFMYLLTFHFLVELFVALSDLFQFLSLHLTCGLEIPLVNKFKKSTRIINCSYTVPSFFLLIVIFLNSGL